MFTKFRHERITKFSAIPLVNEIAKDDKLPNPCCMSNPTNKNEAAAEIIDGIVTIDCALTRSEW